MKLDYNTVELAKFKGIEFKLIWCSSCKTEVVICPECKNNCCNGTSSEGCTMCKLSHEFNNEINNV